MTPIYPLRRTDLQASDVVDELILYDEAGRAVHVLNPTARLVWDLCDAQHTSEDMAQALRARFAIPPDRDVLADVTGTLAVFSAKALLQSPKPELLPESQEDHRPGADDLTRKKGAGAHESEGTTDGRDPRGTPAL